MKRLGDRLGAKRLKSCRGREELEIITVKRSLRGRCNNVSHVFREVFRSFLFVTQRL